MEVSHSIRAQRSYSHLTWHSLIILSGLDKDGAPILITRFSRSIGLAGSQRFKRISVYKLPRESFKNNYVAFNCDPRKRLRYMEAIESVTLVCVRNSPVTREKHKGKRYKVLLHERPIKFVNLSRTFHVFPFEFMKLRSVQRPAA